MLLKKFILSLSVLLLLMAPSTGYSYSHRSKFENKKGKPFQSRELSRSSEWQARDLTPAPAYITFKHDHPVLQVGVLNRSGLISNKLLKDTLNVVTKQVKKDFAPYYGIEIEFTVFKDQIEVDWTRYIPLIIPDYIVTPGSILGDLSFHDLQDSTGLNGTPISTWVTNPPALPEGTPYIIVPIGDLASGYGVNWAFLNFPNDASLPPTFDRIFSQSVSHESLETIVNGGVNTYLSYFDSYSPVEAFFFFKECCDPVEFTPGYTLECLTVANFVLPSYWIDPTPGGPYDFLNTVTSPMIPYAGIQFFIFLTDCGAEEWYYVSPYATPTVLGYIDEGSLTSCVNCSPCPCITP